MLMKEPSPEMISSWRKTFALYRSRLRPNKKPAGEIISFLTGKYPATVIDDENIAVVVRENILQNEHDAKKLSAGSVPVVRAFVIENTGSGSNLYLQQDDLFKGTRIIVGIDLETAFFMVEGSSLLWDEICAFRGLDHEDLENYYLVAEYIACVKTYGRLCDVLGPES